MNAFKRTGFGPNALTLLLILTYAGTFMGRQIMSVMIEPIKNEYQASDTTIGIITGLAFAVIYAFCGLYAGRLADRHSRVAILTISLLLWAIATLLSGATTSLAALAISRMIVAAMESATTPAALSIISDLYAPSKRTIPISLYAGSPTIAIILGMSVGAWVVNNYGWRSGFVFAAMPIMLAVIILYFFGKEPTRGQWEDVSRAKQQPKSLLESLQQIINNKPSFWLVASTAISSFCAFSFVTWNTPFLVRSHNLSLQEAGILVGMISGTTALIGTLFTGWFASRMMLSNKAWLVRIPIIGNIGNLITSIIYLLAPPQIAFELFGVSIPSAMAWCVLAGFFSAFWLGPSLTLLATWVSPEERSTTFALQNISSTVAGIGLGPFIVGILSDLLAQQYGDESLRIALIIVVSFTILPIAILLAIHYKNSLFGMIK